MIYFFAFLVLLISAFCILSSKYNNPYSLFLVVGKKGSGKSTLLCKKALWYSKHGYNVISNVALTNIDYIYITSPSDISLLDFGGKKNVLLLDEAGIWFDSRDFKSFPKELLYFFKYQRKLHCICWLFSQSLDVDKKIRDLCDRLLLTRCIGGWLCVAHWIDRTITFTKASDFAGSTIADELKPAFPLFPSSWIFTFSPGLSKYFDTNDISIRKD